MAKFQESPGDEREPLSDLAKAFDPKSNGAMSERFLPGSWINEEELGVGVVLSVEEPTLTARFSNQTISLFISAEATNIRKADRPALDLSLSREQRRVWCWLGKRFDPCPCCGYPNLGEGFDVEPRQCLICGWIDEGDGEDDADEVRPIPDPANPDDWEWPNWGYSLTVARRNFDLDGVMFRADDPRRKAFEACIEERKNLCGLLDEIIVNEQTIEVWPIVKDVRSSILRVLQEGAL